MYRAVLQSLASDHEGSRFVRVVRDEVVVRRPADAAAHLLQKIFVPFDRFDQEELWVCAVERQGSIGYSIPCRKESMQPTSPSILAGR